MQKRKGKLGYYLTGSAIRHLFYLFFVLLFFLPKQTLSQEKSRLNLREALLDLAKEEKQSIVFSSNKIPQKEVDLLPNNRPLKDRLAHLLKGTDIFFEMKNNQIFLYKKHKLYGYVEDAKSGERLISALLFIPSSGEYEVTNEFGYFSLSSRLDSLEIEVSYLGYATQKILFTEDELDRSTVISLDIDNDIHEVLITDNLVSKDDRKHIELDKGSDILLGGNQAISSLGGEPDIFQAMMRQSGVSSGTDGIGGIHVRGGKNDQNLILYDGVKLYNSAHAFGMFSVINSNIVDRARMHKSGASGSNSGRLSSVLDIKLKDPNLKEIEGNIQLSSLAAQANIEVPLLLDKLGLMISGRRTYIDPYIDKVTKLPVNEILGEEKTDYGFHDLNAKLFGILNKRNRIYITLYQGKDNYTNDYLFNFDDEFDEPYYFGQDLYYNWSNKLGALRWNSLLGNNTFANFQISAYQYDYRNRYETKTYDGYIDTETSFTNLFTNNAQTTNFEFKYDFETISKRHHFKYGLNASHKVYQIGEFINIEEESPFGEFYEIDISEVIPDTLLGYSNYELTLYFSDKVKISNSWILEGGIYQTIHKSLDEEIHLKPRSATYGYLKTLNKINNAIYIGGSIGSFVQTEHLLSTGDNGYPNDIWVPSTENIPFQRSNQIELFSEIEHRNHTLRLSTYYKKQSGLLRYAEYPKLPGLADLPPESWEYDVKLGTSEGYGFELDYSYKLEDRLSFRSAYSYGKTDYQFDEINGGIPFPFDFSIPHTFSLGSNIKLLGKLKLTFDWFISSGKPFTLYESVDLYSPLDIGGNIFDGEISGENELRLPTNHKLSVMLSTEWKWSKIQNNLSFGVQNIYNQRNVILQYKLEGAGIRSQQGFPILPLFLYRISFGN